MILYTFDDLINFIKTNNLTISQTKEIISKGLNLYFVYEYESTNEMILILEDFWLVWGDSEEKPFLIDLNPNIFK